MKLAHQERRTAVVRDVTEVIKQMQNSPTAAYLRDCSFHERMILASLVKYIKREGGDEIKWGEVCIPLVVFSLYSNDELDFM